MVKSANSTIDLNPLKFKELKKELKAILEDLEYYFSAINIDIVMAHKNYPESFSFNKSRMRKIRVATVKLEKLFLKFRLSSKRYELISTANKQKKGKRQSRLPTNLEDS